MAYNDYIVLVDENGSPYIAHRQEEGSGGGAGGNLRTKGFKRTWNTWKNRVTKYKDKIPLGNGKFRYVYDDVKKKAGNARKNFNRNVLGSTAKTSRDIAKQNYMNAARGGNSSKTRALKEAFERSQGAYDKTLMGRAENASRKVRNSKAARTLRKYKNKTLATIYKAKEKRADKKRRKESREANPGNYKNRKDPDRI